MMNLLKPQISHSGDTSDKPVYLLWSRDGNLDNKPNVWYIPNHIVPVISVPPPGAQQQLHADAINMRVLPSQYSALTT